MSEEKNRITDPIEDFLRSDGESSPDDLFQVVSEDEGFNPFGDPFEEGQVKEDSDSPKSKPASDPFEAALAKAQADSGQRHIEALCGALPVFSYAGAKEDISDPEITFDGLREKYQTDFPELSEKKKVSWTVSYGKINKVFSNPESDKVVGYRTFQKIRRKKP